MVTTQKQRILYLLQMRGLAGATQGALNNISFRYSARIADLRNDGHNIMSMHIRGGKWLFIYLGRTA